MRVEMVTSLASISAYSKDLQRNQFHTDDSGFLEKQKLLQFGGHAAEFKFESKLSPCRSSGNDFRRLFQKAVESFYCKIIGLALGATLWSLEQPWV